MKHRLNYLLVVCVLVLAVACFLSVSSPLTFERQRAEREKVVMERLHIIGQAQETYCRQHGHYAESLDTLVRNGLLADSLLFVPYSDHERFSLRTTVEITPSGRSLPQMECGAHYRQYLHGLDEAAIGSLTEKAEQTGDYPGVKVGGF